MYAYCAPAYCRWITCFDLEFPLCVHIVGLLEGPLFLQTCREPSSMAMVQPAWDCCELGNDETSLLRHPPIRPLQALVFASPFAHSSCGRRSVILFSLQSHMGNIPKQGLSHWRGKMAMSVCTTSELLQFSSRGGSAPCIPSHHGCPKT